MIHDKDDDKVAKDIGSVQVPKQSYIPGSLHSLIKRQISETELRVFVDIDNWEMSRGK